MAGGIRCFHSKEVAIWLTVRAGRWLANASHRIKRKKRREKNESIEPIEEMAFQVAKASG